MAKKNTDLQKDLYKRIQTDNGIIFNNALQTNKDQFMKDFKEHYEKQETIIIDCTTALKKAIQDAGAMLQHMDQITIDPKEGDRVGRQFDDAWKNFSHKVLQNTNTDIELWVLMRGENGSSIESASRVLKEEEVHGTAQSYITTEDTHYGIKTGKEVEELLDYSMKENKAKKQLLEAMNLHFMGFKQTLDTQPGSKDVTNIRKYFSDFIKIADEPSKQKTKDDPLRNSLIGSIFITGYTSNTPPIQGKYYEAFVQHIALFEKPVLDWLRSDSRTKKEWKDIFGKESVFQEEGGFLKHSHFPRLLHDASSNNRAWFTGGDVITLGNDSAVDFNLQVKTTKWSSQSTFKIALTKLEELTDRILKTRGNSQAMAENLYKALETQVTYIK